MSLARLVIVVLCTVMVLLATVPVFAGLYQFLLVAGSVFQTHAEGVGAVVPRVSILIPAWNEEAVIGGTIERLIQMDYPTERLKIWVIDDGSTDGTPRIALEKAALYPGRVMHLRRPNGGQGKAHTLNYGLTELWRSDWTEAVLIMDADVIYTQTALLRMARHLADPAVGAVTAYIKEGSAQPNLVQRFITFEYITATGVSRRAQNVLGFLACLSGGAQLHTRENLMAIGGQIFDDTLAEDTFTTFKTQLAGRRALFEPNAIVYAEEPDSLEMLWKQRLRWARGNVQITQVYQSLWFNPREHATLGSHSMAVIWFSIVLMPLLQIGATLSLWTLLALDPGLSWALFRLLWVVAGVVYLTVTSISMVIDVESARKSWLEGVVFPGLVSLAIILWSLWPPLIAPIAHWLPEPNSTTHTAGLVCLYGWLTGAMVVSWCAKEAENRGWLKSSTVLLMLGGYGPFLCAVTFASYVMEWRGAERVWDKTVKTGKIG